jgi:polyhydroxyalkanoate synthesis regulator phasin
MFSVKKNELSDKIYPFDNQVVNTNEPLLQGHRVWLIVGRRGLGKSNLILNSLTRKESPYYKVFDNIYLINPSHSDPKYSELVDELSEQGKFYDELNDTNIKSIFEHIAEYKKSMKEKKQKKIRNLLIIEDSAYNFPTSKKSVIHSCFVNGRHRNLSVWVVTQKYNLLPTIWRSQADMISMFPTESKQELDTLINDLNIDKDKFDSIYKFAIDGPNDFLHMTLTNPIRYYKKFDEIER